MREKVVYTGSTKSVPPSVVKQYDPFYVSENERHWKLCKSLKCL